MVATRKHIMDKQSVITEPLSQGKLLYTIDEAARTLALGRSTIKQLIRTGRLHSVLVFGARRIPADALRDLAARGTGTEQ
jgi:excisionase family DNA binding protein